MHVKVGTVGCGIEPVGDGLSMNGKCVVRHLKCFCICVEITWGQKPSILSIIVHGSAMHQVADVNGCDALGWTPCAVACSCAVVGDELRAAFTLSMIAGKQFGHRGVAVSCEV
eukprot:4970814-Amphidinium_carterae.1